MTSRRTVFLLLPLLLVNSAAVYGQAGWAYDHLAHNWIIAGLFAASVESIGIYLAYEAHAALMAGDASARLRLGSYLVGVLAGALNFAHFASDGYQPNPLAVTFGLLSSISPWLWAIRSRSLNRDRLRDLGQIDPRAVRFSVLRWVLFPVRTSAAFRAAVWAGIVQPSEAVAAADARRAAKRGVPMSVTPAAPVIDSDETIFDLGALSAPSEQTAIPAAPVSDTVSDISAERKPRQPLTTEQRVRRAISRNPDASVADIARSLRLTERTVHRHKVAINGGATPNLTADVVSVINGVEVT